MRVVVAAVPFGKLNSIPMRARLEKALKQAEVPYEVTQTALLLDPGAQIRAFAKRRPPFLYFLVQESDLVRAQQAVGSVDTHSLEA